MSEPASRFECRDCPVKTLSVDVAERHEHRTGHDVWEVEHTLLVTPASVAAAQRDAFLVSPDLDPSWVAGWHSAADHITHTLERATVATVEHVATLPLGAVLHCADNHVREVILWNGQVALRDFADEHTTSLDALLPAVLVTTPVGMRRKSVPA